MTIFVGKLEDFCYSLQDTNDRIEEKMKELTEKCKNG